MSAKGTVQLWLIYLISSCRYADGSVQLIYKGGDYCHGSELHRSTIINFHCGHDAGVGSPVFSGKDGCDNGAYIFDWTTSATCLDTGASTTLCEVTQGDSTFDLSPLNTGRELILNRARHNVPWFNEQTTLKS